MRRKVITIVVIVLLLPLYTYSDIWKKHVDSNYAYEVLGNDKEIWVLSKGGGLTRWDLESGEYDRFYDGNGFLSTNYINGITYDGEENLVLLEASEKILRYDKGEFKLIGTTPKEFEYFGYAGGYFIFGDRFNKGVYRYDGKTWDSIPILGSYTAYSLSCPFAQDPSGGFWFSYYNGSFGVLCFQDNVIKYSFTTSQVIGIPDTDKKSIICGLDIDDSGVVWACLYGGIAWFDGEEWSQYWWDKEMFRYPAKNATMDTDDVVWVARGIKGLLKYDGDEWFEVPQYEGENVLWVEKDPQGGLWVGTEECLEHFDGTNRVEYKIDNLLPIGNELKALDVDENGNLWCGDLVGDIAFLNRNTWNHFRGRKITNPEGTPPELKSLLASEYSGVWAGYLDDLIRYDGNLWTSYYDILSPEIGGVYSKIVEGPKGDIWIAAYNGTAHFLNDEWEFYPEFYTKDMTFDNDGNLWVISDGIMKFDGTEWKKVINKEDFYHRSDYYPNSITSMNDGTIWGTCRLAIVVFNENKIIRYYTEEDGIPPKYDGVLDFRSIKQAPDRSIWILADYGLVHYDGIQFKAYKSEDAGFVISGGNGFEIDGNGRIFIATYTGLIEFTPTSVTLKMNLFADKVMYGAGDELTLSLMVNNYGPDETGDLYFVMVSPDGLVYSAPDWSESVHPAASDITIPEGYRMPMMPVLTLSLPSGAPPISAPGQYLFAVALADPGTTYFRAKAITAIELK